MKKTSIPILALDGIPDGLRTPLLIEFNKIAKHYRESRWEPTELNGGKLCEIVFTIIKGHVDGTFPSVPSKPPNMVDACNALAKAANFPRSIRIQIPRMLIALYEIRNNRNVGHVGADVDPSHMDATVVYSLVKWIMSELVRVFHNTTPEEATSVVDALAEREIPILWRVGDHVRVLDPKLTAKDKTLALLYGSPDPLSSRKIATYIEYKNITQFKNKILKQLHKDGLIHFDLNSDAVTISPLGIKYAEDNIPLYV